MTTSASKTNRDAAWGCAMLTRHIERQGDHVSRNTGAFYDKALRRTEVAARLDYLERGQAWVVRRLRKLVPGIEDAPLAQDLERMLAMHERNVERCAGLGDGARAGGSPACR